MNKAVAETVNQTGDYLLKIDTVLERLVISRATLYKGMSKDEIPQPIKVCGANRWRNSDIENFIAGKSWRSKGSCDDCVDVETRH